MKRKIIPVTRPGGHPGGDIRAYVKDSGLTQQEAADALGVTRLALNHLVNAKSALTLGMAMRLERVFGIDAEDLLARQAHHDVATLRATMPSDIQALKPLV